MAAPPNSALFSFKTFYFIINVRIPLLRRKAEQNLHLWAPMLITAWKTPRIEGYPVRLDEMFSDMTAPYSVSYYALVGNITAYTPSLRVSSNNFITFRPLRESVVYHAHGPICSHIFSVGTTCERVHLGINLLLFSPPNPASPAYLQLVIALAGISNTNKFFWAAQAGLLQEELPLYRQLKRKSCPFEELCCSGQNETRAFVMPWAGSSTFGGKLFSSL